jgi:putative chitinase
MRSGRELLCEAMDAQGVTDDELRAGIGALCGGESNFEPVPETGYRNTQNTRIRMIFGAAKNMSDAELNRLKTNDADFFEAMYGMHTGAGRQLGNTRPGDGHRYRGRGFLQLTGRANYGRYGSLTGHPELVDDPNLANEPDIAAAIAVAYMRDRYRGGGFQAMKRAVGNSFGAVDARKESLFRQYVADRSFAQGNIAVAAADVAAADTEVPPDALCNGDVGPEVATAQRALIAAGFFCGPDGDDGDFGNATESAVIAFQRERGLEESGVVDELTRRALGLA